MIRFCIPIIDNNSEKINKKKENIIPTVNEDDLTASPKSIGTQTEISYSIPNLQNQLTNGNYLNKKIYKNKPTGRKKKMIIIHYQNIISIVMIIVYIKLKLEY